MLTIEKPPLNEELLAHYGIPGMKWGRRKARPTSAQATKSAPRKKWSTQKKLAVGGAVLFGAAAVATLSTSAGRTKVASLIGRKASKPSVVSQPGILSRKVSDIPSPRSMLEDARRAGARNSVARSINQQLTERTWRDSARLSRAQRIPSVADLINQQSQRAGTIRNVTSAGDTQAANLLGASQRQLQNALNNPNHIWQL